MPEIFQFLIPYRSEKKKKYSKSISTSKSIRPFCISNWFRFEMVKHLVTKCFWAIALWDIWIHTIASQGRVFFFSVQTPLLPHAFVCFSTILFFITNDNEKWLNGHGKRATVLKWMRQTTDNCAISSHIFPIFLVLFGSKWKIRYGTLQFKVENPFVIDTSNDQFTQKKRR